MASTRGDLAAYAAIATSARSATEALGPALLLSALAAGRPESDGALLVAGFTGLAALSGPIVGALLDRTTRPGRVITAALGVLVVVLATLVVLVPSAPVLLLVCLAAVGGFAHPALTGGLTSQLPTLVRPDVLDRAYAVDASTYNLGAIVGPPVAAAAVVVGATGPLLFTLLLLVVALAIAPRIRFPLRPAHEGARSPVRDVVTGFRGLVSTPSLGYATVVTTVGFAGQAAFLVAVPLVSRAQTGSLALSGAVFGAAAVGGVLATLWLARRPLLHPDRAITVTTAVVGVCLVVIAFSPTFAVTMLAAFTLGAADGPMLTAIFRVRTREVAPAVRAAVFTTGASLRTSVFALTTAALGAVVAVGPSVLLLLGAALHAIAIALASALWRRSTRVPAAS